MLVAEAVLLDKYCCNEIANFKFIALFIKYEPLTFLSMKKADGFFAFLDEQTG